MQNGTTSAAKSDSLPGFAIGLLAAAFAVGQGGLVEAIRFSRGGYQIFLPEAVRLVAAYALVGFFMAVTGLAIAWVFKVVGRYLPASAIGPQFAMAFLPVWGCTLVAAIFINKGMLPRFFSPISLAANLLLALSAIAISCFLARFTKLRLAVLCLLAIMVVADVTALCFFVVGRGDGDRSDARSLAAVGADRGLPVLVLVVIDTLRADHLGTYGHQKATSPLIDSLAERSVVFERAYSPANWTRPAVASLMTSTRPSLHGVTDFQYALPRSLELLTESLKSVGYRTAIFSGNPNLEPEDGYRRGTDTFVSFSHRGILGRSYLFHRVLATDLPAADKMIRRLLGEPKRLGYEPRRLTDRGLQWLDQNDGARFAYLHYVGPHDPYLPPEDMLRRISDEELDESVARPPGDWAGSEALSVGARRRMIAQYDAEILWHDHEIGRLVSKLKQIAVEEDVVLVVTSDHGEGFGENGVWGHGQGMFDELVRVPLIVWCSRSCGESRRAQSLVSLLDIAPTLLELAGVEPPVSFEGDSLLSILRSPGDYLDRVVLSENPKNSERSIRTSDWSFAEMSVDSLDLAWLWRAGDAKARAVDALMDPPELERAAALQARLAEGEGGPTFRREIELESERMEELRALGYLN